MPEAAAHMLKTLDAITTRQKMYIIIIAHLELSFSAFAGLKAAKARVLQSDTTRSSMDPQEIIIQVEKHELAPCANPQSFA
jgi:hypothetical protein